MLEFRNKLVTFLLPINACKNNSSFRWIITFSKQLSTAWAVDMDKWYCSDAIRHSNSNIFKWAISFYLTCEVSQIIPIQVYICCIHWNWVRGFVMKSKNKRTFNSAIFLIFWQLKWVRHCLLMAESSCNPFSLGINVHKAVLDLFAILMWACLLNWVLPHPAFHVFTILFLPTLS